MHHSESTVAQKSHHCDVKSGAGEQCCHDLGLTRSDPDPSSSDLTLTDG